MADMFAHHAPRGHDDAADASRIMAVVDPDAPPTALQAAADIAERHGAELVAFSCFEPPHDIAVIAHLAQVSPDELMHRMLRHRQEAVEACIARTLSGQSVAIHVATGKPYVEAIRHVLREKIDLVVKAAEPLSGMQRFLFASTDQHLVRKCPCPVWLKMPEAPAAPKRILAAVDVDEADASEPETLRDLNRRVLEACMWLAPGPDAIIHVVHAWDAVGEGLVWAFSAGDAPGIDAQEFAEEIRSGRRRALATLLDPFERRARAEGGPGIDSHLERGSVQSVIADSARRLNVDLIVMGTVARTGLGGIIIGNTAEDILNSLDRSVLAVKPQTFVSPISP